MGIVEASLLFIYALISTGFNVYQANELGKLESERDTYRTISEACSKDVKRERADEIIVSDRRAISEQQSEAAIAEYRESMVSNLPSDSNPCSNTIIGDEPSRLLDDERRLLEELRKSRLQTKP